MTNQMVFIVTRRTRSGNFSDRVLRDVTPLNRNSVVVLEEEAFGIGENKRTNDVIQAAKNISDFIEDANAGYGSYLLIDHEVRASQEKLKHRWEEAGQEANQIYILQQTRLLQKFESVLNDIGFHWRSHAMAQLQRFHGQTTPLDVWCRQFFDLKVGHLGRRLAMQLQVIDFGDQNRPFAPRMHETFGQKVLHCFFDDGDHGGSWVSVQDQLSHDLPSGLVNAISVSGDVFTIPETDADEIVIYEDGLWSGSETVKRLTAIKASGSLRPIRFKFVVVTDFGLMVARQAIRYLELQNIVKIDATDSRLERFLAANIPSHLLFGHEMEPKAYFEALHSCVEISAFQDPKDWPEGTGIDEAREIAKTLGRQLAKQWYERDRPDDDVDEGADKFSLGGGGFASTMMFTRSVPKVCLPLFWLAGQVSLNGKTINWKPLFLDARRVDPQLLRS